ncbi:MAG: hypothetical protein ACTSQY_10790, partial [Candidatus Odinarchaeia archaeon]
EVEYRSVVPHICLGLNKGKIKEEFKALKTIKKYNPELLVVIIFTPTKGTKLENTKTVSKYELERFFALLRLIFPQTELSLGCMRPRKKLKITIDNAAFSTGFNRIVLPSIQIKKSASDKGINIKKFNGCCCLPEKLLSKFEF